MKITKDNVKECWILYEEYLADYKKNHYSDDHDYEEFVSWCEENLYICPNCENIVLKDDQGWLDDPRNSEGVCDYCIEDGFYD